jgi:hypothetical protein
MISKGLISFVSLFDYKTESVKETFEEVIITIGAESHKPIEVESFAKVIELVDARDILQILYIIGDGTALEYNTGCDVEEFIKDFDRRNTIREQEKITVEIRIIKSLVNGTLSVYSYVDFLMYMRNLPIEALFFEFNRWLKVFGFLVFENLIVEPVSNSGTIWFKNKGHLDTPKLLDRPGILNRAKTSCHYNLLPEFVLLPEDFMLEVKGSPELEMFFNRLTIISAVVLLYDISSLIGSKLNYKLNGYKSITGDADLVQLNADSGNQYFKIYQWVYQSGNFNDKIGLARNIISLHLDVKDSIEMKGDPFQSIQSSYKVYEKQNIKQYIEIRNKISDQLLSFHDRANKIIETFAGGFQKSALALITFYTSAIVLKILNKDKLVEVFTLDASILSTAFILCSAGYYFISKWEVNAQRKRFENNYIDIKKRYTDLLDDQDIERILNNDHEFRSDLKFMLDKGMAYTLLWFSFLIILFFTTWFLYCMYNTALITTIVSFFTSGKFVCLFLTFIFSLNKC